MLASAIALALLAAGACVVWLIPGDSGPTEATFRLVQLPVDEPQWYRPFDMGFDPRGAPRGMWLVRSESGAVLALFSRDPHRGCTIELTFLENVDVTPPLADGTPTPAPLPGGSGSASGYTGPGFRSACSGSTFLIDGTRAFGPAPRSLDRFATEIEGGLVRIDVSRIVLGPCSAGVAGAIACSTAERTRTERPRWPRQEPAQR